MGREAKAAGGQPDYDRSIATMNLRDREKRGGKNKVTWRLRLSRRPKRQQGNKAKGMEA